MSNEKCGAGEGEAPEVGNFPVAFPPRYQLPISVRPPPLSRNATLGPTKLLAESARKDPNQA